MKLLGLLWRKKRQFFRGLTSSRAIELLDTHDACCGKAARTILAYWPDHTTSEFGGHAMHQAYLEAERLGCALCGWHRTFCIQLHLMEELGWL